MINGQTHSEGLTQMCGGANTLCWQQQCWSGEDDDDGDEEESGLLSGTELLPVSGKRLRSSGRFD